MKEYEPGEHVLVIQDKDVARIVRLLANGDDKLYEVVFDKTGWHKIVRPDEIEREKKAE